MAATKRASDASPPPPPPPSAIIGRGRSSSCCCCGSSIIADDDKDKDDNVSSSREDDDDVCCSGRFDSHILGLRGGDGLFSDDDDDDDNTSDEDEDGDNNDDGDDNDNTGDEEKDDDDDEGEEDDDEEEEVGDEEEEEDDDDDDDAVEESSTTQSSLTETALGALRKSTERAAAITGRILVETVKAARRALRAAIRGDDDDEEEETETTTTTTMTTTTLKIARRIARMLKRMWHAAIHPDKNPNKGATAATATATTQTTTTKKKKKRRRSGSDSTTTSADTVVPSKADVASSSTAEQKQGELERSSTTIIASDFGRFLSKAYGVDVVAAAADEDAQAAAADDGDDDHQDKSRLSSSRITVQGGSLADAMTLARSQARLLLILIPSQRPTAGKRKRPTYDQLAIRSLLSPEVAAAANKRARKKTKKKATATTTNSKTGSYLLWGARAGSSEAVAALKRIPTLQVKNAGGYKVPVVAVIYPAAVVDKRTGRLKVVAKLLAQHHCSPPPGSKTAAAWLEALRKRHGKEFARLQRALKEAEIAAERAAGYSASVRSDRARRETERVERERQQAQERAERERLETLAVRRRKFVDSLPEEPAASIAGTKLIKMQTTDGRSAQRRFDGRTTTLSTLFDWADAAFEMERETLTLTTLNGRLSFSWIDLDDDKEEDVPSLDQIEGLGRAAAFRVISTPKTTTVSTEDPPSEEDEKY